MEALHNGRPPTPSFTLLALRRRFEAFACAYVQLKFRVKV